MAQASACGGSRKAALLFFMACSSFAQTPQFDVISIKRNTSLSGFAANPSLKGGHLKYTNITVKDMLSVAYPVDELHMSGGPAWLDTEHYDVEAATAEQGVSDERYRQMVRTMLADRFKLSLRRESREEPVYALVPDKKGVKIKPAPDGVDSRTVSLTHLESGGITMPKLAETLSFAVGRKVIDKTGMAGKFAVRLDFSRPDSPADPAAPPSIFTAVQEQLGLRLEPQRAAVDVLVIEHVEKPSEN